MSNFLLVDGDGHVWTVEANPAPEVSRPSGRLHSRTAFAAAHVVPLAWGDNSPGAPADVDWDATLEFRHHLWSWGLGVADAMDTAQRNMGLDGQTTRELIRRSAHEAASVNGDLVVGVNTDHIDDEDISLRETTSAFRRQLDFAHECGAGAVLMGSRHLARAATSAKDYERVYSELLRSAQSPVILHWLGDAFDPHLAGYFGSTDWQEAAGTLLRIIESNPQQVRGVKMSLLSAEAEMWVRQRLPAGIAMFTGDDHHYVDLIAGDAEGQYSDVLLGAFATIGPLASAALQELDATDGTGEQRYRDILGPTEALAQHIFAAPTYYYKTGIAFMAWLNGHQRAFSMLGGLHSARSLPHLSRIVELANSCGALEEPDLAVHRWNELLALHGITAAGRE